MATQDVQKHLKAVDDLMARLQRSMTNKAYFKESQLTASQVFILRYLDKCPQAKASDIAKVAGLSPGAVTQVCDELVKFGYIERSRSNDDRRVVHIALTDAGAEQLDSVRRRRSEHIARLLTELGPDDAQEFIRIIGRVVEIVEKNAETR